MHYWCQALIDCLLVHVPPGLICTRCSPLQVANDAIYDARSICMREYATAPEVTVYGDPAFTFPYVPSHLHHMTFELVRPCWLHASLEPLPSTRNCST